MDLKAVFSKTFTLLIFASFIFSGCDEDEGIPSCSRAAEMVEINAPALNAAFKIFMYEASRAGASDNSEGSGDSQACSASGVQSWSSLSYTEAKTACEASGFHLCTSEEWQFACQSAGANFNYPYANTYQEGHCNDSKGERGEAAPSGEFSECETLQGAFDMVGNLREWVDAGEDSGLVGGSFGSGTLDAICNNKLIPQGGITEYAGGNGDGFRCCTSL